MSLLTAIHRPQFDVFVAAPTDDLRWITITTRPHRDTALITRELYREIHQQLAGDGWKVLHERLFCSLGQHALVLQERNQVLAQRPDWRDRPLTVVQGHPLWGQGLAGVQIQAFRPARPGEGVWPVTQENKVCGRKWTRRGVTYLLLQNLHGLANLADHEAADPAGQASRMFHGAADILRGQGANYRQVARTWIYLAKILDWYDAFNAARNACYTRLGLMPSTQDQVPVPFSLPASTGIEGKNPRGAACVMDLLAVLGDAASHPGMLRLTNLRQKDAFRYGAAFSRGVILNEADCTQLQISGTAAIDEKGHSLFPGDMRAQVLRTLDNIEALIAQAGAKLADIGTATVFLKRAEDAGLYRELMAERGLERFPAVCVVADVCRAELLFELDGVALVAKR